jgi:hypothetical protein
MLKQFSARLYRPRVTLILIPVIAVDNGYYDVALFFSAYLDACPVSTNKPWMTYQQDFYAL